MIKKSLFKYLFLPILLLAAACSNEVDEPGNEEFHQGQPLEIEVHAGDFVTNGNPASRAVDNGTATIFEEGDRLGLTIIDADGNIIADNVPYKYTAGWAFDAENTGGKTQCHYHSFATYLAYFPYSQLADGAKTVDELKARIMPSVDQRSKESYRAADLMVDHGSIHGAPLVINFTHAYASVTLAPKTGFVLDDGQSTVINSMSPASSAVMRFDRVEYLPYKAPDGTHRLILPASFTTGGIETFYTLGDKSYKTIISINEATANTRYIGEPTNRQNYTLDCAAVGDYYCRRDDGADYLIPGTVESLTDGQKQACVGVVFFVGAGNSDSPDNYNGKLSGTIHGYALALRNALYNGVEKPAWSTENGISGVNTGLDAFDGYTNTATIIAKTDYDTTYPAFAAAVANNGISAPTGSSGWYLPSSGQLIAIGKSPGRSLISDNTKKAGGKMMGGFPGIWTSTESASKPETAAQHYYCYYDIAFDDVEKTAVGSCNVRPVITF